MSFTKMTDDLNIIQGLPDLPNDVGGLTAAQLKATYDKAGLLLKKYINEVLLPELEGVTGAENIGISEIQGVNAQNVQRALEILRGQLVDATTGQIPDNSITTAKLSDNAVIENKIADNAVTENKIADNAVTNSKIKSVEASKIDGYVRNIADDAVTEEKIKNFSVTAQKISAGAVVEEKISKNAVTNIKIADGAVTAAKLKDGAVSRSKLAQDALYSPFLGFNSSGTLTISNDDIICSYDSNSEFTDFKVVSFILKLIFDRFDNLIGNPLKILLY